MHYSTCAVVLAAGSSIASASAGSSAGDLSDAELVRRLNFGALLPKLPSVAGIKISTTPVKNPSANKAQASPPQKAVAKTNPPVNTAQDDADAAAARRAARQAATYMSEYQRVHPPGKGQTLADDMPPPMTFQMSSNTYTGTVNANTYQGPVTNQDNRLTAYGGSTIANGGSKVDKSMNDNRQQVAPGATLNGSVNAGRNSRRDVSDTYAPKEDGRVVYRDFVLLVRAMRRNPEAKEQVLYEIAGIPGFRDLVEGLISQYTTTDGQLTMNNFAALVESMTKDKVVETKCVDAFNSNLVFASVIEKLLTKYYEPEDSEDLEKESSSKKKKFSSKKSKKSKSKASGEDFETESSSLSRRYLDNHFSLALRSIEEEYLQVQMQTRDIMDEYESYLAARELDEYNTYLAARALDAEMYDPELFW